MKSRLSGSFRAALLGLLLGVSAGSAAAQAAADPDYSEGRLAWLEKDWARASKHLSRLVVAGADRADNEVLFWLGTSWCRISGKERDGLELLDWAMTFREMPEEARTAFASERQLCSKWVRQPESARLSAPPTATEKVEGRR